MLHFYYHLCFTHDINQLQNQASEHCAYSKGAQYKTSELCKLSKSTSVCSNIKIDAKQDLSDNVGVTQLMNDMELTIFFNYSFTSKSHSILKPPTFSNIKNKRNRHEPT